MPQTTSKLPLTQLLVNPTVSFPADSFDQLIKALTIALGADWQIETLSANLATLEHPKGGLTISLSLHVQRQPQLLIYGNFKQFGDSEQSLFGNRGKHTLYRAASKTPEQVARALKRHLLPAYWRDYAQAQASFNCRQS